MSTYTTASYYAYFADKKGEASTGLAGFYDRRLVSEAFAESMRLKATDSPNYKKRVPAILRNFIDGEIWKKR